MKLIAHQISQKLAQQVTPDKSSTKMTCAANKAEDVIESESKKEVNEGNGRPINYRTTFQ